MSGRTSVASCKAAYQTAPPLADGRGAERAELAGQGRQLRKAPGVGREGRAGKPRCRAVGESGHTTFFIASKEDYDEHAEEIEKEPEVKIMKWIKPRGSALEACVTRHGTIVGPLMTELVGFKELTP